MVSIQFIPPIISADRLVVKPHPLGSPMSGRITLSGMGQPKERTPFGDRLFRARTHAKLTQTQLAKAASISQGNLGELEWTGDGSSATVRLAKACGVRPEWLAEGEGDMLDASAWPFKRVPLTKVSVLESDDLSYVEGALAKALSDLSPLPIEEERRILRRSAGPSQSPAKPVSKRRRG